MIGLKINTALSPHADPNEIGRAFNQALICDPSVAGRRFQREWPFQRRSEYASRRQFLPADDPRRTLAHQGIAPGGRDRAPYFRDGQAATLDEVIEFYDRGGDPQGTFLGGPKEIRPLHLSNDRDRPL